MTLSPHALWRARAMFGLAATGLACSILGGFLPGPTSKTVAPADIAGAYTYTVGDTVVSVTLNADGTFGMADTGGMTALGIWRLDEAQIVLNYTAITSQSREKPGGWYVYDAEDGSGFAIMGGEGDPDAWPGLAPATPRASP